jgi:hypothetical protein
MMMQLGMSRAVRWLTLLWFSGLGVAQAFAAAVMLARFGSEVLQSVSSALILFYLPAFRIAFGVAVFRDKAYSVITAIAFFIGSLIYPFFFLQIVQGVHVPLESALTVLRTQALGTYIDWSLALVVGSYCIWALIARRRELRA